MTTAAAMVVSVARSRCTDLSLHAFEQDLSDAHLCFIFHIYIYEGGGGYNDGGYSGGGGGGGGGYGGRFANLSRVHAYGVDVI